MANSLYDKGRQAFLEGSIAILTDTIKLALVSNSYTPNLATHQYVTDLGANIVARSAALSSKASTAGVFNAANVTLTGITGVAVYYIALFKDTGTDSTSPLIGLIDTATGLPVTPNGGNINVNWDTGANKIFKL